MEAQWEKEDFFWDDDLINKLNETDPFDHVKYDHYIYHLGYRQAIKDFINNVIKYHEDRNKEHKEG